MTEYNIIAQQLKEMSTKIDEISKEIQLTNIEIVKISGMKHALQDIKDWKIKVESVVNPDDLREMKNALSEVKKHTEKIKVLDIDMENNVDKIEELETFKTQTVTVGSIIVLLLTTAITVLGWYLS